MAHGVGVGGRPSQFHGLFANVGEGGVVMSEVEMGRRRAGSSLGKLWL